MGPLEENGYRLGIVAIALGISFQLRELGGYWGDQFVLLGAAIAVVVLFLSTMRILYEAD
jgi:hypothetical protein